MSQSEFEKGLIAQLCKAEARVKVLEALCGEAAGWVVDEKTRDQLMAAGRGEALEGGK